MTGPSELGLSLAVTATPDLVAANGSSQSIIEVVARDANGKVYTVRYEAVNAMLLNEFLKEHRKVERLEAALAAVNEQLKAQDAKIDNSSHRNSSCS